MVTLLIKSSFVIVVLLAFYKFFLEKESHFAINRIYLLACLGLAFVLPFIALPQLIEQQGYAETLIQGEKYIDEEIKEVTSSEKIIEPTFKKEVNGIKEPIKEIVPNLEKVDKELIGSGYNNKNEEFREVLILQRRQNTLADWLLIFYGFGVIVLLLNLIAQLGTMIFKIIRNEDKIKDDDGIIVNMNAIIEPCSFFNYIFINPASYDYDTYEQIIAHEKIHVLKGHTFDLLLAELAVIALWFNPFIWLFRKEVEKNIEYQTDDFLVHHAATEKENYQMNLLKIATYNKPLTVVTNYNQSLIKQRILKMNSKKSTPYSYWKYAFIAPLLCALLLFLNKPIMVSAAADNDLVELSNEETSTKLEIVAKEEKQTSNETIPNKGIVSLVEESTSKENINRIALSNDQEQTIIPTTKKLNIGEERTDCERLLAAANSRDIDKIRAILIDFNPDCMPYANWKDYENMERIHEVAKAGGTIEIDEANDLILVVNKQIQLKNHDYDLPDNFGNVIKDDCTDIQKALAKDDYQLVQNLLMNLGVDCIENAEDEDELTDLMLTKKILRNGGGINIVTNKMIIDIDELVGVSSSDRKEQNNHYRQTEGGKSNVNVPVNINRSRGANHSYISNERNGFDHFDYDDDCQLLLQAVRTKDNEKVKTLLKTIDPNCVNPNEEYEETKVNGHTWRKHKARTPLVAAARNGNFEGGKLLISAGAKINFHHRHDGSALIAAAENGHLDFVKYLLKNGGDLNELSNAHGSPLNAAARKGHTDIVNYLLSQGANIDASTNGQGSALNSAARNGHNETIIRLLAKGADINEQTNGQGSALNAAARNGHTETVRLLIEKGAAIDLQNNGQGSALNAAARNGHAETVKLLIAKGADLDLQNNGQGSALNAAARNGNTEMVKLLIEAGANLDISTNGQGSALNAAARNGHTELVKLLLAKGANINEQTNGQGSALNAASRNGHNEMVKLLLEKGADIDLQNNGQGSALNAAARNGNLTTAKLLLSKGADVNVMSNGQGTALMAATKNGYYQMVQLLLENGADPYLSPNHQESPNDRAHKDRNKRMIKLFDEYKKQY